MRVFVAISLAVATGIIVFAAAAGLTGSIPVAFLIGGVGAGIAGWALWTGPILALDEAATSRALINCLPQTATVVLAVLGLRRRVEAEGSTLSV